MQPMPPREREALRAGVAPSAVRRRRGQRPGVIGQAAADVGAGRGGVRAVGAAERGARLGSWPRNRRRRPSPACRGSDPCRSFLGTGTERPSRPGGGRRPTRPASSGRRIGPQPPIDRRPRSRRPRPASASLLPAHRDPSWTSSLGASVRRHPSCRTPRPGTEYAGRALPWEQGRCVNGPRTCRRPRSVSECSQLSDRARGLATRLVREGRRWRRSSTATPTRPAVRARAAIAPKRRGRGSTDHLAHQRPIRPIWVRIDHRPRQLERGRLRPVRFLP